jgi:metal-responsive CopG/Arc/MetJ family transcriptional regulator
MRTTIVLDDTLYEKLKISIPQRKISNFINQLIKEKLAEVEKEAITKKMKEGYLNTKKDRKELDKDWDSILAEGWK